MPLFPLAIGHVSVATGSLLDSAEQMRGAAREEAAYAGRGKEILAVAQEIERSRKNALESSMNFPWGGGGGGGGPCAGECAHAHASPRHAEKL